MLEYRDLEGPSCTTSQPEQSLGRSVLATLYLSRESKFFDPHTRVESAVVIILLTTAVGCLPVEGVQAGLHLMPRGVLPEFPHDSSVASAFKSSSVSMAHDTLAVWKSRERRHPARCADGYWSCRNMKRHACHTGSCKG